jgi:hypothetical protein
MRPSILVALAFVTILAPGSGVLAAEAAHFQFEQQARQHCPGDTIVWLNPSLGTYSFAGDRWYGSTRHGVFVCRREGDLAGYRPSHEPAKNRPPVTQAALPAAAE